MGKIYSLDEARRLRAQGLAGIERDLALPIGGRPLVSMAKGFDERGLQDRQGPRREEGTRLPLAGIAIVAVAVSLYALIGFHFCGQVHYSARANLLPPINLGNED